MNEDEWTTHQNFVQVFRRGKQMTGEPYFYFYCGASAAPCAPGPTGPLRADFCRPQRRLQEASVLQQDFTDTKDLDIIIPPTYSKNSKRSAQCLESSTTRTSTFIRTLSETLLQGSLFHHSSLWGLRPATIRQPLKPIRPEVLLNHEPEFAPFNLDARMDGDRLTIKDPVDSSRRKVGAQGAAVRGAGGRAHGLPGQISGAGGFAHPPAGERGRCATHHGDRADGKQDPPEAGEIFKAPYFILDITYDRFPSATAFRRSSGRARSRMSRSKG